MDYKTILTIAGVGLTIFGPLPYIRDIIRGKTKPHTITWLIWTILVGSAFWIQVIGGGGLGSLVLGFTAIMNLIILGFALRSTKQTVTKFDIFILFLALIAFIFWWLSNNPMLGAILLTLVLIFGFIPTYKKSFNAPQQETISLYTLAAVKQAVGISALLSYNVLTLLFPAVVLLANIGLVSLLVKRQRQV
jgi:hypothetical protein